MKNKQTPESLLVEDNKKNKQLKLVIIVIVMQIVFVVLLGLIMSMYDPGAPWSTARTFYASLFAGILGLFILPVAGVLSLIFVGHLIYKKKNYSTLIWVLLVTSLCLTTYIPVNYISKKIAGLFNYNWTEQAAKEQQIIGEQQKAKYKILADQEPANIIWVDTHNKLLNELYQKMKLNINGEHKIIAVDKANLKITIDNGQTYILNTDSIIRKTAGESIISIYNDIMTNKYKNHTYLFTLGDFQSFKNYYDEVYRDNVELKKVIDNFKTNTFVIPIPTLIN